MGPVHLLWLAHLRGIDRAGLLSADYPRGPGEQPDGRTPSALLSRAATDRARFARRECSRTCCCDAWERDAAAASIGATVYQLGPFFASQTQHLGAIDAAAWLPLSWMAIVDLSERFTWRWVGVSSAEPIDVDSVRISRRHRGRLHLLLPAGLRAVFLAKRVWVSSRALLWAIALAGIQILPTAELNRLSVAKYRSDWSGDGGGHPLQALISLVIPNYWGIFQFEGSHLQTALESHLSLPLLSDSSDWLSRSSRCSGGRIGTRCPFVGAHRGLPALDAGRAHARRAHDFPLASSYRERCRSTPSTRCRRSALGMATLAGSWRAAIAAGQAARDSGRGGRGVRHRSDRGQLVPAHEHELPSTTSPASPTTSTTASKRFPSRCENW